MSSLPISILGLSALIFISMSVSMGDDDIIISTDYLLQGLSNWNPLDPESTQDLLTLLNLWDPLATESTIRELTIAVDADKEVYEIGEDSILISVLVGNPNPFSRELTFTSSCKVNYQVLKDGEQVFDSSDRACATVMTYLKIPSLASETVEEPHDLSANPLPSGDLVIDAEVIGYGTNSTMITVSGSEPTPQAELSIEPMVFSFETFPGGFEGFDLTIYNNDSEITLEEVFFSVTGGIEGWVFGLEAVDSIPPMGNEYVFPYIEVPTDTQDGTYTGYIMAASSNGGEKTIEVVVEVRSAEMIVSPENISIKLIPGLTVVENLQISNTGGVALSGVTLTAVGLEENLAFTKNDFSVNINGKENVAVTISAPDTDGTFTGSISVSSANGGTLEIPVEIITQGCVEMTSSPETLEVTSSAGSKKIGELIIRNGGTIPIEGVIYIPTDDLVSGWVSFSRDELSISPEGFEQLLVTVEVPGDTAPGEYPVEALVENLTCRGGVISIPITITVQ